MARFDKLRIVDQDTKSRLAPLIRHHLFRVVWKRFHLLQRAHAFSVPVAYFLILIAPFLSIMSPGVFGDMTIYGPSLLLLPFAMGWVCAFYVLSDLSWAELSEYLMRMRSKHRYWWIGPFFYFAAVYIDPGYPFHPKTIFGAASGIVELLLSVTGGAWTAVHALVDLEVSNEKTRLEREPESFIVDSYLQILDFVDSHPSCLRRAADKRKLIALLEQVALIMQRDLPEPVRASGPASDVWFVNRANQMATAVRSLKTWILSPKPDTLEQFTQRIITDLSSVAAGHLDAVPTDDSKPVQEKTVWIRGSLLLLRGIIVAIMLLLATHSTKLEPHWVFANYTFLLIAFPLFVTLSERIDPVISPVISSYKETLKSMQEIGKKSEH